MALVRDVVCGREVDTDAVNRQVATDYGGVGETDPSHGTKRYYKGKWYYFCSLECRMKFTVNPEQYIEASPQEVG